MNECYAISVKGTDICFFPSVGTSSTYLHNWEPKYLVYQLPPSAAAAAGRRAPVFCASGRAVGGRPLDAERRRERLRLAARVRPVAAEGVRRAGPPRQRPRPAEAVPDAGDGREPDVLQLDDLLLLGEVAIRCVSQGNLVRFLTS